MPLTIVKVKNAKPAEKLRKLSDGGGLYLVIFPAGGKYRRVKYRVNGKEKVLALGTFPEVSLAEAREGRDSARKRLRNGVDPVEARKAAKAANAGDPANSFEAVAREWHGKYLHTWFSGHAKAKL